MAAVRRETTSADGELLSVVGETEVTYIYIYKYHIVKKKKGFFSQSG